MEAPPPPGLIWADALVARCAITGEPLEIRTATLELVGTGDSPATLDMGWSAGAGCCYVLLDSLVGWSDDAGISPLEAGPFLIDGEAQQAAVLLSEMGTLIPWDVFAAQMQTLAPSDRPAPTFREVRDLPELPETWELAYDEADDFDGLPGPVFVAVVSDAAGLPRASQVRTERFLVSDLAAVVRLATLPRPGTPLTAARPREVRVDAPRLASKLKAELKPSGIRVRRGETVQADLLLDDLLEHLWQQAGGGLPPLFEQDSDAELTAFFDAAGRFYAARPWERLDGHRFLAVQDVDAGPGSPWAYVSILGQMGEEHGLSLFTDWADVCALVHDRSSLAAELFSDDPDAFDGGPAEPVLEGVTLFPASVLHADDRERLEALGIGLTASQQVAVPTRYEDGDPGPLRLPLPLVTAVLAALPDVLAKRRAQRVTSIKATVEAAGTRLALRYPATGAEGLAPGLGDVRVTVENDADDPADPHGSRYSIDSVERGERLVVDGPAGASAYALGRAVRKMFEAAGRWGVLTAILADGRELWNGRATASEAAPTLDDLLRAERVVFQMGLSFYPACVERLAARAAPEVRAEIVAA